MSFAVRVDNLSKCYPLQNSARACATYRTLREDLVGLFRSPLRSVFGGGQQEFWALRDVSFDVPPGQVLGIVGRNGAGKSTLLKLLSRITEPTHGRIRVRGRIGSLLEVGTGFHPELTGRENIFLSGAVLGMSKAEIQRKFDEIVAFAEIEQFLDLPVKRYSSGMYMRLAFAVAAHLEPDVLVIDEVLAVGDSEFQKKCMTRMGGVAAQGRTILFVSHNLGAIERLCQMAIHIEKGQVVQWGKPSDVIAAYLGQHGDGALEWNRAAPFPEHPHFRRLRLCHADGSDCPQPTSSSALGVEIEFALPSTAKGLIMSAAAKRQQGEWLFATSPADAGRAMPEKPGIYRTRLALPPAIFFPRRFALTFAIYDKFQGYDTQYDAIVFDVVETASLCNLLPNGRVGDLQIQCDWEPCQLQD
jgi:lipopolysaccharide transport system ATP-binding protein